MQSVERTGWVSKELEALWCCRVLQNTRNEWERTNVSSEISRSITLMTVFGSGELDLKWFCPNCCFWLQIRLLGQTKKDLGWQSLMTTLFEVTKTLGNNVALLFKLTIIKQSLTRVKTWNNKSHRDKDCIFWGDTCSAYVLSFKKNTILMPFYPKGDAFQYITF